VGFGAHHVQEESYKVKACCSVNKCDQNNHLYAMSAISDDCINDGKNQNKFRNNITNKLKNIVFIFLITSLI